MDGRLVSTAARVAKLASSESIRLDDPSPSESIQGDHADNREIKRKGFREAKRASLLTGTTVTTPPPSLPTASTTAVPLGSRKEHGVQRYSTCSSGTL
jgi:hypothetical protein